MNNRRMNFVAWLIAGIVAISAILQLATSLARAGVQAPGVVGQVLWALLAVVFAFVFALIVSRQPRNTIGWLLIAPAIALAVPVQGYISSSIAAQPTPLLLIALWYQGWYWLLLILPPLFIALLFPTGQPPTRNWRWVGLAGLILFAAFVFFSTFATPLVVLNNAGDVVWFTPNPIGFLPVEAFPMQVWLILLGIFTLTCAAALIVRYRRAATIERVQIKWLLYAATAFAVAYAALLLFIPQDSPLINAVDVVLPVILLPIPVAVAVAILRYRLWNIDLIIRRTLVYVPLTAILAGVFAASSSVSQKVLGALTGGQSDASTVLTTLIVAAAFDPAKRWIQRIVDGYFKEAENPKARWQAYGEQVRAFVQMHDAHAMAKRLLEESAVVFEAQGGAVFLEEAGALVRVHQIGDEKGAAAISVPLEHAGNRLGELILIARRGGRPYDEQDRRLLAENAGYVAAAIALDGQKRN